MSFNSFTAASLALGASVISLVAPAARADVYDSFGIYGIVIPVPSQSADPMEKHWKPVAGTAARHASGPPKKPPATAVMKPNPNSLAWAATS